MYRVGTARRTACRPSRAAAAKTTPPRPMPSEAAMPFGREVETATLATMTKLGPGLTAPMTSAPTMPNSDATSCMSVSLGAWGESSLLHLLPHRSRAEVGRQVDDERGEHFLLGILVARGAADTLLG